MQFVGAFFAFGCNALAGKTKVRPIFLSFHLTAGGKTGQIDKNVNNGRASKLALLDLRGLTAL